MSRALKIPSFRFRRIFSGVIKLPTWASARGGRLPCGGHLKYDTPENLPQWPYTRAYTGCRPFPSSGKSTVGCGAIDPLGQAGF
jgi:hypothetical protein